MGRAVRLDAQTTCHCVSVSGVVTCTKPAVKLSFYVLLNVQVNGDAFIGRTFDNGDDFRRLDFKVSEVSSSAAWVQVWPCPNPFPIYSP